MRGPLLDYAHIVVRFCATNSTETLRELRAVNSRAVCVLKQYPNNVSNISHSLNIHLGVRLQVIAVAMMSFRQE